MEWLFTVIQIKSWIEFTLWKVIWSLIVTMPLKVSLSKECTKNIELGNWFTWFYPTIPNMLITQRNITISDMLGPMSETTLHINSFSEVSEKYWKVPHDDTLTLMFRNIYNYSHFKHNIDQGRERRGYYFCIEFHWYSNIVLYVQLKCPGSATK